MAGEVAAPPKSGRRGMIIGVLSALLALGGGAALPWMVDLHRHDNHAAKKVEPTRVKQTAVAFGDVVVNLGEDRLNRYLRSKILVAVEEADAKEVGELMTQKRAFLKSWLIGYLFDQPTKEVTTRAGVNRIRREIRDQFNAMLYPDGEEKIVDVLFDEFVIQQ